MNEKDLQQMLNICALNEIQRLQEEEEEQEKKEEDERIATLKAKREEGSDKTPPQPVQASHFGPRKSETDSNDFLLQLGFAAAAGIASKIFKRK